MSVFLASVAFRPAIFKAILFASGLYDGENPPGDGGVFAPVMEIITSLARDFWGVAIGLIIIAATLGMIISVLRGAGGMLIGGSKETTVAVIGIVGIVLLVVISFVAVPQLADLMKSLTPAAPF